MTCRVKRYSPQVFAVVCLLLGGAASMGDAPREVADQPGFRPDSPQAGTFVAALDDATLVVHPAIVRRAQRTAHSFASRSQSVELLEAAGIAAMPGNSRVDLGQLAGRSQWDLFQNSLPRIAEAVKGRHLEAQYHLVLEFLLPVSDGEIFGIQCYVLDQEGNNAFSFLLNSHHRLFAAAKLFARNRSEEARSAMLARATEVAIAALQEQIRQQQDAAQVAAKNAWNIFYSGDKATAIRRFNQAWLLDPRNQLALWGFAVTCVDRGQHEEAAHYYRMAIESGPSNPGLERDYRLTLRRLEETRLAGQEIEQR